jgi:hypothetical protein
MALDPWFLIRYNWIDLKAFIVSPIFFSILTLYTFPYHSFLFLQYRTRDVYSSYFFALCSRMPAICMLISTFALMAFLGLVAFEVWPQGVLAVSFFIGIIMSLQFLVFGAWWRANKLVEGGSGCQPVSDSEYNERWPTCLLESIRSFPACLMIRP